MKVLHSDSGELLSPKILCVHQGGELYGSDRSFLQAVSALRSAWPAAHIQVLLAVDGPLRPLLEKVADHVLVRDLNVLRLADPVSTLFKSTLALPWYLVTCLREMAWADLVYVNTAVIADFMLGARWAPKKTVIHVREIPKPQAMPVVRALVRASRASIIFNSHATSQAFALPDDMRQAVVHNGVDAVAEPTPLEMPQRFSAERPLRIAMLGRISAWKGQDLLIEAIGLISPDAQKALSVRIVGSAFRDAQKPVEKLKKQIALLGLVNVIRIEPFTEDPSPVYRWCDLCVMPSRLPEPFGRVAVEAMAHGRGVIAADHGGLSEIVDKQSGWLVRPGDAQELASSIEEAVNAPKKVQEAGTGALDRFGRFFSSQAMESNLVAALRQMMPAFANPSGAT